MIAGASPVEMILSKLVNVRPRGSGQWDANCPCHDDRHRSLSVGMGDDGRALLRCFTGCPFDAILDSIDMRPADLFPKTGSAPGPSVNGHRPGTTTRYPIRDEGGTVVAVHVRRDRDDHTKSVSWELPGGQSGLGGTPVANLPLSGVHELGDATEVVVCEGEKARDALAAASFGAVGTVTGAAGCPSDASLQPLVGRTVILWPDNDNPGREHMEKIARRLLALGQPAVAIRWVDWPDAPPKGDAADCPAEVARRLVAEAPHWTACRGSESSNSSNSNQPNATATPAFPVEVLPPAVRAYVEAAAESIPVPVEMVAVPLLGAAGALLGNRFSLSLKLSYREYPSLYLAIIAPPGTAKSPALKLAVWALDVLQRRSMERYREELAGFEADVERWKGRKPEDRGEKPTRPVLRHYFSSNLTLEALVGMLERSPGVAIIRDEILSWIRSMDQYRGGKGSDRQEFLSLWASQTIKADRKGAEPIYRPYPVAAVIGGVQPDFVADLHDEARRRDGFVERLLPIVLDEGAGRWTEATIDPTRFTGVLDVFERLDRLPPADVSGDPTKPVGIAVELAPEARALWADWYNENAALIDHAPALAGGFYRKLPAHVARLALILHALWSPDDPRPMLSLERMADAIELGEFFRAHIGRLLPLLGAAGDSRPAGLSARIHRILRNAASDDVEGWVSRSAILDGLRNVRTDDLSTALSASLSAGTVETRTVPTPTKPVEQWRMRRGEDSDYSDFLDQDTGDSEFSEYPNNDDPTLAETVTNLLALPPVELSQYREQLAEAGPDDPYLAHDRAALAVVDRRLSEVAS